jgi:hypothetical protein
MQKNASSIGNVNVSLILMFDERDTMVLNGEQTRLCELLINAHKKKFQFELNSNVYKVASILNVSDLYIWYKSRLFKDYVSSALSSLTSVIYEINEQSNLADAKTANEEAAYKENM